MQSNDPDALSESAHSGSGDWLRLAPFFAVVCAAFAWLKSNQYHSYGQLPNEQGATFLFVTLSLPCVVVTLTRFRRYRREGWAKLFFMVAICFMVLVVDALAIWNLSTATVGAKDRLF